MGNALSVHCHLSNVTEQNFFSRIYIRFSTSTSELSSRFFFSMHKNLMV